MVIIETGSSQTILTSSKLSDFTVHRTINIVESYKDESN